MHGTSSKTVPVHGGGVKQSPSFPRSRKTAICWRVTGLAGQ